MTSTVKRIAAGVVALVLVAAAVVAGLRIFAPGKPTHIQAVFSSTVGLYQGSDVRVLGVKIGKVTSVKPQGDSVLVGLDIDADQHIAPTTGAVVIAPSLVSDRYVQLTQPWVEGPSMPAGTTIAESKTAVPVELDQLYGSLDQLATGLGPNGANKDGALSDLLRTGAANLKGNGADINKLVRQFGDATGTLSASDDDLFTTVKNLDDFNQVLVQNDDAVGQVNTQLATVSQYLADDRDDLAQAISTLGTSLTQVEKFIRDNRGHLRSSLRKLTGTTRLLDHQKSSLTEVLRTLPGALKSFLAAYNPSASALNVRVDVNELSLWPPSGSGASTPDAADAGAGGGTSADAPVFILPSVGDR